MASRYKIKMSSNRSFGLVFFTVFIIISLWPLKSGGNLSFWPLVVSLIFLILGVLNSKILTPLNKLWYKFGISLGAILAPIVMSFIFFLVITPIRFIMNLIGKDLLNKKFDKNKKTYWIKRDTPTNTMKRQY